MSTAPAPRGTIACFGEIMLRMTAPGRELLLQSARLDVCVGGAEANVATGLACLGHHARMVGLLPANPLGMHAIGELRRHGVDVSTLATAAGRMGLYFLTPGAGLRASDIVYDRAYSAFALAAADAIDWTVALGGMDWLHLSGITPALGPVPAQAALRAVAAAKAAGVKISFDGNYRARLWEAWDSDPRTILTELVSSADLFFGNHRDMALLLGTPFDGDGADRRRHAAEAAFTAFPNLRWIASTARQVDDADRHRLSARIDTPERHWQTQEAVVAGIVDRIGGGDAFAAGVLHGLLSGHGEESAVAAGLALACLKHSLPGDASLFGQSDIDAFLEGGLDVRR